MMINIQNGSILISALSLDEDPYFKRSVVFIAEHNEKGTIGFVINRKFDRKLNELIEFQQSLPFNLFYGGPVGVQSLFMVHKVPVFIDDSVLVTDSVYMGGNFKQALAFMNKKIIAEEDIKLFIGYTGWDYGQLDEEIKGGSWLSVETTLQTVFSGYNKFLWEELYERKEFLSLN